MKTEKILHPRQSDYFCFKCGAQMNFSSSVETKRFLHTIIVCHDCDVVVDIAEDFNNEN